MGNSAGFTIKPCEERALAVANQRRIEAEKRSRSIDRQAFTELGAAVRKLQKALEPFAGNAGAHSWVLLALMQAAQLPILAAQSDYRDMVDGLNNPLKILNAAAIVGAGGAGNTLNPSIDRWINFAAQSWAENECGKASSSASGRFFRALNDFQGRNPDVYSVTERQLRSAFKQRDVKGAMPIE